MLKKILIPLCVLCMILFSCETSHQEKRFAIVTFSPDNLDSIAQQAYRNYRIIHTPSGGLANLCQSVFRCDKDEIVVLLGEKGRFTGPEVLSKLNQLYQNEEVWATRGKQIQTFYAGLFQEIRKADFLYQGAFFEKVGDLAYSLPLEQLAGEHIKTQDLLELPDTQMEDRAMAESLKNREKQAPLAGLSFLKKETFSIPVYNQIQDIRHPAFEDYKLIQNYLEDDKRYGLSRFGDMLPRIRMTKIYEEALQDQMVSGTAYINSDKEDRANCILLYASFNHNYPNSLKRLLKLIQESDFKGHVLYRIGGWPNLEEGSLALAHVPYAFKVSFFKEAQKLGYKRALWLDTAVIPIVSLNRIFDMIQEKGYFIMGNYHTIGEFMNPESAAFFGMTLKETYKIPSCSAGLTGVDFTKEIGRNIIDWWGHAAQDKDAFFAPRSDQSALSAILYKLNISDFVPLTRMPVYYPGSTPPPGALFWLDRAFAHSQAKYE